MKKARREKEMKKEMKKARREIYWVVACSETVGLLARVERLVRLHVVCLELAKVLEWVESLFSVF